MQLVGHQLNRPGLEHVKLLAKYDVSILRPLSDVRNHCYAWLRNINLAALKLKENVKWYLQNIGQKFLLLCHRVIALYLVCNFCSNWKEQEKGIFKTLFYVFPFFHFSFTMQPLSFQRPQMGNLSVRSGALVFTNSPDQAALRQF